MANFKRASGVKASVVAGTGHSVSLDINVLLEGTPPQAHSLLTEVGGTRGCCVCPETNIKRNRLCMHEHV